MGEYKLKMVYSSIIYLVAEREKLPVVEPEKVNYTWKIRYNFYRWRTKKIILRYM